MPSPSCVGFRLIDFCSRLLPWRHFRLCWSCGLLVILFCGFLGLAASQGQTSQATKIRVDTTPARAIAFDPDKALGTSIDILPARNFEKVYTEPILKDSLSAGWGPISYRQNTELTVEAWHWNQNGAWSDPPHQSGYFVGSAEPGAEPLRESFGYALPHRGTTRSDEDAVQFSRLTDGDESTYWKSNPYLAKKFTGEDDAHLPQWVVIDFGAPQQIDALRISWANPYATKYEVSYWTGDDAMNKQAAGYWTVFPSGGVENGKGGVVTLRLAEFPIVARYVQIRMTQSSNTCDTHGPSDPRNCVGYAINELYAGNFSSTGQFLDIIKHTPGQAQTMTYVSSVDPWHTAADKVPIRVQTGFDLFYTSGLTNHLPAMIPIAMVYAVPEDAAAEIAYVENRGYPISHVEMGEEPDGEFMTPEDDAALYVQFADALHRVDPKLKLGGPIFTGENEDIKTWADDFGRDSWLERFVDYLRVHGHLKDLAFVSFEHYPLPPCTINWTDLYREPQLVTHIMQVWREDGVPADVPLMITESNISWALTDPMQDTFAALWLADSVGAFFAGGGAVYYHSPIQPEPLRSGCEGFSTFGNFVADEKLDVLQHTSQYFASRLINLEWVKHGGGVDQLFPSEADLRDDAGHDLITSYAVKRPDGEWSIMVVNRDPSSAHPVDIEFASGGGGKVGHFAGRVTMVTFGAEQYVWHPEGAKSHADPDGPPATSTLDLSSGGSITLPRASITVIRGQVQ